MSLTHKRRPNLTSWGEVREDAALRVGDERRFSVCPPALTAVTWQRVQPRARCTSGTCCPGKWRRSSQSITGKTAAPLRCLVL